MMAFIILLISMFLSRMINEKATKKLDQEKKAALIDVFSKDRIWTYGVLIGIVILFFLSLKFDLLDPFWTYTIYIVALMAYIVTLAYFSYKKLKANGFPGFYIKAFILSTSLRLIGILVFLGMLEF